MVNEAAAALGRLRWKGSSREERTEHARLMNEAKLTAMTPEQRKEVAQKAAKARWGKRKPATKKKR